MDIPMGKLGQNEKIIFIHGAGGSSRSWYFQKEYFKGSMEAIMIDLPGHGADACSKGYKKMADYVVYIEKVIHEIGIDKCYIAGHSMGGAIAMSLALSCPDILKGIILITTGAKLRIFPEILNELKKDKEKAVKSIMDCTFSKKSPIILKENGFKDMMKCKAEVIYDDFLACEEFDITDSVNKIKVPALIICGNDDILAPPEYSEFLHDRIKGSRLVAIDDAGHMPILEKPFEINKTIYEWILSH